MQSMKAKQLRMKLKVFYKQSICLLFITLCYSSNAHSFRGAIAFWQSTPMTMTWNTNNTSAGSSTSNQAQLPLVSGATYNFTVEWGDGNKSIITSWDDTDNPHTYAAPGTYKIRLSGRFDRLYFNNTGDRLKILDVTAWGNNKWTTMASMFAGCANLAITANDVPNLVEVEDMSQLFMGAYIFNKDIGNWNTSNVTDMNGMFSNARAFNHNIASWDTSKVTNMYKMFERAHAFNQDIASWNTSSVTDMNGMFTAAYVFNQDLSGWDVSAVITRPPEDFSSSANDWVLPQPSW